MGWIVIADIIIMGLLASVIVRAIFGDGPLGRFLGIIGFIAGALLYSSLLGWANNGLENSDLISVIIFGPIGLLLLLLLLSYVFAGQKKVS